MSRVAVWLHNYGNEKHLRDTIESVLKQTLIDFTLYIFDNHSPQPAVRDIIDYHAARDQRIVVVEMPPGLAGIPAMDYAWTYLDNTQHDYSSTIGGHDLWPNEKHLEVLVKRADQELHTFKRPFSIIYTDTYQLNGDNQIVGRFQNIIQQAGQTGRPFIPQLVISSVDSPQFYGLWNEAVRKRVPIRHLCAGFDHLVVMHANLYGVLLWEPNTALLMRCPPPGDSLAGYAQRHFSPEDQQGKDQDFINQLEWLFHCVDEACTELTDPRTQTTYRALLTASMFSTYLLLRGYNLEIFTGGMAAFQSRPEVQKALTLLAEAAKSVRQLTP